MLLQNPVEVKGAPTAGRKSACLGHIVSPDCLDSGVLIVTFSACPSYSAPERHQSILPCGDGAFPAIQLPLSGKELLLQLNDQCRRGHRV
jgi:hypothetical protein